MSNLLVTLSDPLADSAWDNDLHSFPSASFFHSSGWARVLITTYGYRPFYLRCLRGDRVVGLLPLVEARSWLTGTRGICLPFTDDCPVLALDDEVEQALWQHAQQLARDLGWRYLEYRGNFKQGSNTPSVTYLNHRLRLSPDPDEVFSRLHSSTRRAIRKAEKSGLTSEVCHDESAVEEYYQLHCQTRKFHGLPPQSWTFFRHLHQHAISTGGCVVLVRNQGRPIGGGVFFQFGKVATYKFGASERAALSLRPNNLMMWTAIRFFSKSGVETFDFGRTSVWNAGLRLFKSHWGTVETSINYFRWIPSLGEFARAHDPAQGWQVHLFQTLPISVSRLIGKLLYRHVA